MTQIEESYPRRPRCTRIVCVVDFLLRAFGGFKNGLDNRKSRRTAVTPLRLVVSFNKKKSAETQRDHKVAVDTAQVR